MNCWKSINITRQYGIHRIILISFIIALLSFILFFLSFSLIFQGEAVSSHFFGWFCLAIASIFPLHKLFHALPLLATKKEMKFRWEIIGLIPLITLKIQKPFSKIQSYIVFLTPFVFITFIMILLATIFPNYYHYFSILAALNIGLCIPDLLYVKQIQAAPRSCQIEELNNDGYDILVISENEIAS
ncbi:DUF3267 domain-containing protein [Sutcliffiella halmapala]|uniref:DUF3267 domain-containing protein n=1 Tax=Sutcliffiella halmapala TaxID=79882 RepID=UPI000994C1EA|nr:DUF3267 domain-containing protein [Sutcliffiella halmapala]